MDILDWKAIRHLMTHGRVTWADLAGILGLSAPAAADRVRYLEAQGVIKGYAALINPDAVGCGLTAFVSVTLERPEHRAPFLAWVDEQAEVQECHHVAGDDDYLLKVRCRDTRHLDNLIGDRLKALPGIRRTRTTIVLSTTKETTELPLPPEV
jgi:Lrp/AsnC family leucine-responsive transcriptional regulator